MSPTVICRAFFHSPPMEIKKTTGIVYYKKIMLLCDTKP